MKEWVLEVENCSRPDWAASRGVILINLDRDHPDRVSPLSRMILVSRKREVH